MGARFHLPDDIAHDLRGPPDVVHERTRGSCHPGVAAVLGSRAKVGGRAPNACEWRRDTVTLSPPLLTRSCIDYFERLSSLLRDPVYYGWGVRKGSDESVLLIPGFFAGDWMMAAMARWLARIGYRPYLSGIDWNVGCPGRTVELLGRRIQKIARAGFRWSWWVTAWGECWRAQSRSDFPSWYATL